MKKNPQAPDLIIDSDVLQAAIRMIEGNGKYYKVHHTLVPFESKCECGSQRVTASSEKGILCADCGIKSEYFKIIK